MIDIYAPTASDDLSLRELDLYHLLMEYRDGLGLDAIPLSQGLTLTAGRHVLDSRENIWRAGLELPEGTNLHSWSDAPYYGDHRSPEVMWLAPDRLGTEYSAPGFEISAAGYTNIVEALEGWKSSSGHNAVIANLSGWANFEWTAIGIGVIDETDSSLDFNGRAYHVWFGYETDPAGVPDIIGTSGADTILGTSFDDKIYAKGGSDTVDGAGGTDTLYLEANYAAYQISESGGGWSLARAGTTTQATGIENFAFSDQTLTAGNLQNPSTGEDADRPLLFGRYDLNGDGYDDLLALNSSTGAMGSLSMPDASWKGLGVSGTAWKIVGFGKFDADDASSDILWFNETSGAVGRLDFDGNNTPSWASLGRAGSDWTSLGAGDFDGNGLDDVLWLNASTGGVGQFALSASGVAWSGLGRVGSGWDFAGIGDFNGDGLDDILWHNFSTGGLGMFEMDASGPSWTGIARMGSGYSVVGIGDFRDAHGASDGDDILVYHENTRKLGHYDLYESAGQQNADWHGMGAAGTGWNLAGIGDFNGDNRDDLLWQNDNGRLGRFEMDGDSWGWSTSGSVGSAWDLMI